MLFQSNNISKSFLSIGTLCLSASISFAQGNDSSTEMLLPVTPTLSPDGKTIVFSWKHDLWSKSVDSDENADVKRLTFHPGRETSPLFSPDGKTIYYNSNREGSTQIWSMRADGVGQPTQVTRHSATNSIEDISGDGSEIIYRSVREATGRAPQRLFRQDIAGEKPEEMLFNASAKSGKLSPDGKKILITREGIDPYRKYYHGTQSSQIWLYDIASETFTQPVKSKYGVLSPLWLKDGSGFYFVSGESGNFNLWKHNIATSKSEQLTQYKEDSVMFPVLSNNGETIIFRKLFHFYSYDTNSGKINKIKLQHNLDIEPKTITDTVLKTCTDADFSPSGLEIAFAANGELYAMDTVLREPKRLTTTAAYEKNIYFADKGKAIYYISDDGVETAIKKLTKKKSTDFWWETEEVIEETIISSEDTIQGFSFSPDEKLIAYNTAAGDLTVYNRKKKSSKVMASSWSPPQFDWSPDSEWLTYSFSDNDFNSDIYLAPIDGSEEPTNITKHPDNEQGPSFSPDGKKIAFFGKRRGTSYDLYYVDLTPTGTEKSSRDKKLEQAKKTMKSDPSYRNTASKIKETLNKLKIKSKEKKKSDDKDKDAKVEKKKNKESDTKSKEKSDKNEQPQKKKKEKEKKYDLVDIQKRIVKMNQRGVSPSYTFWKPDSSSILIPTSRSIQSVNLKSKQSSDYTKEAGSPIRFDKKGNLYWVSKGVPGVVKGGRPTNYSFSIQTEKDKQAYNRRVFRLIWRTMRDGFYDEGMNGKNWDAILEKYEDAAAAAPKAEDFDRIVSMLLGELNGSHMGFRSSSNSSWSNRQAWREEMRHLGIKYEATTDGWLVTKVYPKGPADKSVSKLEVGDTITSIDGKKVDSSTIQYSVLWGQLKDAMHLKVKNNDGKEREVKLVATSSSTIRRIASSEVIDSNKKMVEKLSNGKLGYVHISRMTWDEFELFEQHLYENGAGKDGIVIDVRDNGGGFTTDHLLTALTQPRHAFTVPRNGGRGYPQDRFVYATWDKPIVVLCNQNSFSNAEIFAHAITTLKRGKVVGVTTAGGVISTGSRRIMNAGSLRMPFRGWFNVNTGQDMELDGAIPHHTVWNKPGELSAGIDKQIEKAVEVLTNDVKELKENTKIVKPIYRNRK